MTPENIKALAEKYFDFAEIEDGPNNISIRFGKIIDPERDETKYCIVHYGDAIKLINFETDIAEDILILDASAADVYAEIENWLKPLKMLEVLER